MGREKVVGEGGRIVAWEKGKKVERMDGSMEGSMEAWIDLRGVFYNRCFTG